VFSVSDMTKIFKILFLLRYLEKTSHEQASQQP